MRGPAILARTIGKATSRGNASAAWQYHSRSDAHSKVACWTVLFDLLIECDALRKAAAERRIGFGINHVMVGPINKTLDLVVTLVPAARESATRQSFVGMATAYGIELDTADLVVLNALPVIERDRENDVSEVMLALEAKACMTEHVKSLPRLHAEILATGYLAKKAAPQCIMASYNLVNAADRFVTPSRPDKPNRHPQPEAAASVVRMLATAIPRIGESAAFGFDAVGVTVLDCRNDGSPVRVIDTPPAPSTADHVHYERMVRALCSSLWARLPR